MRMRLAIFAALLAACGSSSAPPPPPPTAATFAILVPRQLSWCASAQIVVDALDARGNVVGDYRGTVHFASDDPAAVLPADYTFTAADGGNHAFTVAMRTPGARKITVSDASNAISKVVDAQTGGWCSLGPDHAFVMSLAADPRNPAVVYAGTFEAGIFKSTDGGATWAPANAGVKTRFIPSVVVDGSGTVYATGGIGIYKSTDGAANWIDTFDAAGVKLVVDSSTPGTLYAATSPGVNGFGVLRTTNAGITWSKINTGLPQTNVGMNAIAVDPANPLVLYASFLDHTAYITTDAGAHWTPITNPGQDILTLEVDSSSVVFAGTGLASFASRDHGATWRLAATPSGAQVGGTVLIDPRFPSVVYGGGSNGQFAKTEDGGVTWTAFGVAGVTAIAASPAGGAILVGTNENGVLKSTDALATTAPANAGLRASVARAVVLAPGSSSNVFAATDGHFASSTDGGATWKETPLQGAELLAIDPQAPSTIYASGLTGPVQKSTDSGAHWTAINPVNTGGIIAMAMAPDDPSTLYFGTEVGGLLKTADGGKSSTGLGPAGAWIWSVAVDGNHPGTFYATQMNGPVLKSTDGGLTLTPLAGLPEQVDQIPAVVLSDSTVLVAFREGIFRSVDQGATWTKATGTPSPPLSMFPETMAVDPAHPATVYVFDGFTEALYRSTDAGASWVQTASTLPPEQGVFSLAVFDGTLYGAARGMGVFKNLTAGD